MNDSGQPRGIALHLEEVLIILLMGGLVSMAYANGTPVLEAIEKSRLTYMTTMALPFIVAIAWLRGQAERVSYVIRDWWQVLGALAVYESLKHLHANRITQWLGIAPRDDWMIAADRALFGDILPVLAAPFASDMMVDAMWVFYVWGYYLTPAVFLCWAYFVRHEDDLFLRLRKGLVLGLLGGYILYLVVPVAGPLFTVFDRFTNSIATQPFMARQTFDSLRYNWDCFPSLHTAIPWALTLIAWSSMGLAGRIAAVAMASGITLSTILLRYHYGIDLIAGLVWALIVALAVRKDARLIKPIPVMSGNGLVGSFKPHHLLGLFFVITGASALLAEQSFEKMLTTVLGASTPAVAVVLAVYFLGLSLGAWLYARQSSRVRSPLLAFAALEGAVALWALGIYLCFEQVQTVFEPLLRIGADVPLLLAVLRGVVAMAWILPPTMCMGASFPAVVDAISRLGSENQRRSVAWVYTLNLLGAMAGALLGPTIAFPRWGVDGTLLFTALMDGIVCVCGLRLAAGVPGMARPLPFSTEEKTQTAGMSGFSWLLGLAFVSGFIFFAMEVLWTHLLSAVMGNSVYVFSTVLALVLLSLLAGGAISTFLFPRNKAVPLSVVGWACFLAGCVLCLQILAWPEVPARFSEAGLEVQGFAEGELYRWWFAAQLIVPVATLAGVVYPMLFRLQSFPLSEQARHAGHVSVANTAGCIAGALLTGFVLIPQLGSENSLRVLVVLLASIAVGIGWVVFGCRRWWVGAAAFALAVSLLLLPRWDLLSLTSGEHVYFRRNQVWPASRLEMFHEDTYGGITTVVSNPAKIRGQGRPYLSLLTNGKFQGNDAWEMEAQTGFAAIPGLLSRSFNHACVIGLGTGRSAAALAAFDFQHVDIAEISPGIVHAARKYFSHVNHDILSRKGTTLWLEDGRNLLLLKDDWECDLVTMELTSVWFAGATNLYSREFYTLARKRMTEEGVLQQWIQLHHIGRAEIGSVLQTIQSVFPYVGLWVFGGQGVVVASNSPLSYKPAALGRFLCGAKDLGLSATQARALVQTMMQSLVLAPEAMPALVGNGRYVENTDRNRYLEYTTPRYNLSLIDHAADNLKWLQNFSAGDVPVDGGAVLPVQPVCP